MNEHLEANRAWWNDTVSPPAQSSFYDVGGFHIEFLHEFHFGCYRMLPFMEEDENGRWWLKKADGSTRDPASIPLLFSLKATR